MNDYVHGYHAREGERLGDQAQTLQELLHQGTVYQPGQHVLEVGCGVGAQTQILTVRHPQTFFTAIDVSADSIAQARARVTSDRVEFHQTSLFDMPLQGEAYDHVFVCFVLEHLLDPVAALKHLKQLLKPGGTLTVIEGDHGSFYCHPETHAARQVVQCLVDLQAEAGGNALIGRQLYPLCVEAGFEQVEVSPRWVYVDASRPDWVEGFSRKTFIAMVAGIKEQALAQDLIGSSAWQQGMNDLNRATEADGVFCYCFFKALAWLGSDSM